MEITAIGLRNLATASLLAAGLNAGAAETGSWQRIAVSSAGDTVTVNGQERRILPGCSTPGDDYSFWYRAGKSDKLLVLFNGGGACWNSATCVVSLGLPRPTYSPTDDIPDNDPRTRGGLLNLDHPDNPYRDWSMLFLPYCTGDVHIGSKDTSYPAPDGTLRPIRHRGFDNFLAARNWIALRSGGASKVLVAGVSAGAYGALINFPHLKGAFPKAKMYLVADSGNGVLWPPFLQDALGTAWGAYDNLASPLLSPLRNVDEQNFIVTAYSLLANAYPKDRFSQYTTAWDITQTLFFNIMRHPDDPASWQATLPSVLGLWDVTMQNLLLAESSASNYRYYVAPGCNHTVLRAEDRFYSAAQVGGVSFLTWIKAQTSGNDPADDSKWRNVSCQPLSATNPMLQCDPPNTLEKLQACAPN